MKRSWKSVKGNKSGKKENWRLFYHKGYSSTSILLIYHSVLRFTKKVTRYWNFVVCCSNGRVKEFIIFSYSKSSRGSFTYIFLEVLRRSAKSLPLSLIVIIRTSVEVGKICFIVNVMTNLAVWKGHLWGHSDILNPLKLKISMHILRNVLCKFPKALTRRISLTIESFFSWWSFLYSRDLNVGFRGDIVRRN